MILAMLLGVHSLVSILILSMPNLTRREILFGVAVPIDFRSSSEGRLAIRMYRSVVALLAMAGLIAIASRGREFFPVLILAPLTTVAGGLIAFVRQNQNLKPFAAQPPPVRELELVAEPERLPWFTWLGLVPPLLLVTTALYLNAHWDSIPARFPVHYGLDGNPNRCVDRSVKGVYRSVFFGMEMVVWFFAFALAIWHGARRSEPLRKPTVGLLVAVEWMFALTMAGVSVGP
jgi:uncharacterized membrane protein